MRRALLVDIDDTIVDWRGPARDAVVRAVATHPSLAGRDPDETAARFFEIVEETHALWVAGTLSVDELRMERIRRLVAESGTELEASEAAELARSYRDEYLAARRQVRGAGELLAEVRRRGARVVAVTNNLVAEQEDKLRDTGLRQLVDAMVVSEAVGVAKPDPRIFAIAVEAAECAPSATIMLGDSWENDVMGARAAGIAAAWLNRLNVATPSEVDGVIELHALEPVGEMADRLIG